MDFLMDSIVSPEKAKDKRMNAFLPHKYRPPTPSPKRLREAFVGILPPRPVSAPPIASRCDVPAGDDDAHASEHVCQGGSGGAGRRPARPPSATRSRGAERVPGEVSEDPSVLGVLDEGDEMVWQGSEEVFDEASNLSAGAAEAKGGYVEEAAQTDLIPQLEAIKAVEASARDASTRRRRPRHWTPWEPASQVRVGFRV